MASKANFYHSERIWSNNIGCIQRKTVRRLRLLIKNLTGLNLEGDMCRCAILIGIPFPSLEDSRVNHKLNWMERNKLSKLNRNTWMTQEAIQAVNQALGRVIRNKDDYGIVVLADNRFTNQQLRSNLSHWTLPYQLTL